MDSTYEADSKVIEPVVKVYNHLDDMVLDPREGARPGHRVPLRTLFRGDVVQAIIEVVEVYKPLTSVEHVRNQYNLDIQKHEQTLGETWTLATEICRLIQAKAARHTFLEEWLEPQIGNNPTARALSLSNMNERIRARKEDLAKAKLELGLWDGHSYELVKKQLVADEVAQSELKRLKDDLATDEKRRLEFRAKTEKLQPRINKALEYALGDTDRTLLESFGWYEPPPAKPKGKGKAEGKGEKKADEKKDKKDEKKTDAKTETKPETKAETKTPPTPGPVASGTAGMIPPADAKAGDSKAPDAAPEASAKETKPQTSTAN